MLNTVERGRQIAFRELATRTEVFHWTVGDHHDLDADIGSPLFEGLEEADKLPLLMALGCLCHLLMQNEKKNCCVGLDDQRTSEACSTRSTVYYGAALQREGEKRDDCHPHGAHECRQ